ncbi:MAG: DEAD/DEAH box helicase [Planctomycetes bacterium]|nr:DEAD/DEAH box helicase [Planctomycetota bacterium]
MSFASGQPDPQPEAGTDPASIESSPSPAPAEAGTDPFEAVPHALRDALARRGFAQLTAVQSAVLAADDGARDLQISSQTGSGKTVALGFVLAARMVARGTTPKGPNTLIVTPTRELAQQVKDELAWLFADLRGVRLDCVTGGTHVGAEQQRLRRMPSVLVGTPGRLHDHLRSGTLDLSEVTQVVLDEADQMLDLGFRDDLLAILAAMPAERRTHLVSATFPPDVRALMREYQREPLHVEGTALGVAHEDIEHVVHPIETKDRYAALVNLLLLAGDARTLVFVRTRAETAELADRLTADGFAAQPISGELTQVLRTRTLAAFRKGLVTALIATDVAARGLDIEGVSTVVHFDPPMDGSIYTHRSGRTGRAGQKGRSVLLSPKGAERRVRRILTDARVRPTWQPVPDAATVRQHQRAAAEAALRGALAEHAPNAAQREFAERLLGEFPPIDLVAGLLAKLATHAPRAPFDVKSPDAPSNERASRERPVREPASRARFGDRIRFKINWGGTQGGDPKRILAHVCRRGSISSQDVGEIDVRAFSATFDVAATVAAEFAQRVAGRDSRDPHLVIQPFPQHGRPSADRDRTNRPSRSFGRARFGAAHES